MGIGVVENKARYITYTDNWNIDEYDIGYAKIHHSYNPKRNYCTVEFKMPSLSRQFPEEQARETEDTYHYPHLHRMNFTKVENVDFHKFMDKEGRGTIDKIRYYEGNHLITYYFSSSRRVGLLKHDYMMAILIYLNFPARFFTRRTPCKKLDPRCIPYCIKVLKAPIVSWVFDPEPNTARFDKFFFSYISEKHRLCMGYTIDDIKSNDTCFEPAEPDYYTIDLNAKYFKEAEWDKNKWEQSIIRERKELDREMYAVYDGGADVRFDGEALEYGSCGFGTYTGVASVAKYNYAKFDNIPMQLKEAVDSKDFTKLWQFDMLAINSRNSIHKWTFNGWHHLCNHISNGWWCAWNMKEAVDAGMSGAPAIAASAQVNAQINMALSMTGWGIVNDNTSTDTEFWQVFPKFNGYTYVSHFEPLPIRD